jgi:hypothetical protein
MIAPWLFIFMTILGGAIRPGYNPNSETISELFSPGSPNKLFLDSLHTIFAMLLILFGIGMVKFFQKSKSHKKLGITGASFYVAMGLLSVTTAAIFPQDAWGTMPTLAGELHKVISGVIGLLTIISMALLGVWFIRTGTSTKFGVYSFITIGMAVLATGWYAVNIGRPLMGLTERAAALIGFQWTFALALWMYSRIDIQSGQ